MNRSKQSNHGGYKRKKNRRRGGGAMDLEGRVAEAGGSMGFGLEVDPSSSSPWDVNDDMDHNESTSAGLYGRRASCTISAIQQARLFDTPSTRNNNDENHNRTMTTGNSTKGGGSTTDGHCDQMPRGAASRVSTTDRSRRSRFSRAKLNSTATSYATPAVHIVCAISENLARETCVASLDAGAATTLQVTKQGNGQTYAETLAYLEVLKPHEVLLNEGRRTSQLTRKILELYNVQGLIANHSLHAAETSRRRRTSTTTATNNNNGRHGRQFHSSSATNATDYNESTTVQGRECDEDRFGSCATGTVVKFVSRSCFDQTKGAELLRRISREETYNASVVEEYILLSSAHAVLNYTQQSLGSNFSAGCLFLSINSGGNNRMAIDRTTLLQLELLVNSQTGKVKNSLVGTIDKTKTTAGSRLLRTNLMSPPTQVDTINARLELVETFLQNEDFFYDVLNHLSHLPDVDKMLTNIALIPRKKNQEDAGFESANMRLASRGISALVCIKSALAACPAFAGVLKNQLAAIEEQNPSPGGQRQGQHAADDSTHITGRTSLLIGLGGAAPGGNSTSTRTQPERSHLLRAIMFATSQPALAEVLDAVSDVFTASTEYVRNAEAMRHQECFALKADESGVMSILRKAFLANVDDMFSKADEYAEKYGFQVTVKFSGSRGHYLVIPADMGKDLPQVFLQPSVSGRHIHCSTEEINSLNLRARENVHDLLVLTYDRIQNVLDIAREHYDSIAALCDAIALLDLCHSFADTVSLSRLPWCKPQVSKHPIYDESGQARNKLMIVNGRFGIDVGTAGGQGPDAYISNDTYATGEKRFTLITGINGSGKSTYLKQLAIIVVLAHCGSYVPAEQALIPLRDRLCTRIGNADNQENNISTFLLEMKETAFICNSANENSLVLIDELGRATSNEDGVAIAWSVAEYLLKKRSTVFFVTHYPQLSRLADIYPSVQNVHLEASVTKGDNGGIEYTHKVKSGACAVSTDYGVELAACCGWPRDVVVEARMIESDVEALLPSEGPCGDYSSETNTRRRAFDILSTIGETLKGFIQVQQGQSFRSIRSELHALQRVHVPQQAYADLLEKMDQLLFREPPPPARTIQQEEVVENMEPATATARHEEDSNGDDTSSLSSESDDSSDSSSSSDSSLSDARP